MVCVVLFCRSFRLPSVIVETPEKTVASNRVFDVDSHRSAVRQATLFTLQTLCHPEGVSPPRTKSDALVRAREWLAAMAQLERVRDERDVLKAEH